MSALYSTWDIVEDLVLRKVNASDATQFAKLCNCCPAQVWGAIWMLVSLAFITAAILGALYAFK